MNFKISSKKPSVDLDALSRQIDREDYVTPRTREISDPYAPPHIRNGLNGPGPAEEAVEKVEKFGDLPTKELDEIVKAAEESIADLKRDAQAVRVLYVKHTSRIAADIKRLHEGVKLSIELMDKLRAQCIQLDQTPQPKPEKLAN